MFLNLFDEMKSAKIPVSLREYLTFLEALTAGVAIFDVNDFYYLARTSLVRTRDILIGSIRFFRMYLKGSRPLKLKKFSKKLKFQMNG